jgi:hypothetical protein
MNPGVAYPLDHPITDRTTRNIDHTESHLITSLDVSMARVSSGQEKLGLFSPVTGPGWAGSPGGDPSGERDDDFSVRLLGVH